MDHDTLPWLGTNSSYFALASGDGTNESKNTKLIARHHHHHLDDWDIGSEGKMGVNGHTHHAPQPPPPSDKPKEKPKKTPELVRRRDQKYRAQFLDCVRRKDLKTCKQQWHEYTLQKEEFASCVDGAGWAACWKQYIDRLYACAWIHGHDYCKEHLYDNAHETPGPYTSICGQVPYLHDCNSGYMLPPDEQSEEFAGGAMLPYFMKGYFEEEERLDSELQEAAAHKDAPGSDDPDLQNGGELSRPHYIGTRSVLANAACSHVNDTWVRGNLPCRAGFEQDKAACTRDGGRWIDFDGTCLPILSVQGSEAEPVQRRSIGEDYDVTFPPPKRSIGEDYDETFPPPKRSIGEDYDETFPPPKRSTGEDYDETFPPPKRSIGEDYDETFPPPKRSIGEDYDETFPPPKRSVGEDYDETFPPPKRSIGEDYDETFPPLKRSIGEDYDETFPPPKRSENQESESIQLPGRYSQHRRLSWALERFECTKAHGVWNLKERTCIHREHSQSL